MKTIKRDYKDEKLKHNKKIKRKQYCLVCGKSFTLKGKISQFCNRCKETGNIQRNEFSEYMWE